MDTQIIVVFCLCADMLKSLHHYEDSQCRMSDAEVMTTAIVAMLYFKGNFCLSSQYLHEHRYIPNMLSRSRFNRRLHRIADLFLTLFLRLGETWKKLNENSVYVIDSYPIAVCDNYRIRRSKIYRGEDFRGYIASKKRYFYGLRIHILVTEQGEPVEFFLEPGAFSDTSALNLYDFDLPEGSFVTGLGRNFAGYGGNTLCWGHTFGHLCHDFASSIRCGNFLQAWCERLDRWRG
jgi:hypothetical protein